MPEPILALTDVETIRRIARQALEVLGEPFDEDFDLAETETIRRGNLRIDGAKEALRFCAVAAGLLGDPALVPLIVEAYEALNEFDRDAPEHASVAASAVAELLRAGAPVTAEIRAFARHSDACAREAVAAGLRPIGPEALEILESLSGDAHPEVRTSARKTLAAVREVSWWRGKFRSDPVPRLTPDEIDRIARLLRQSLAAGGLGLSSSLAETHNDGDGRPVPSRYADRAELLALARVTGEYEGTTLEFIPTVAAFFADHDIELMTDMSRAADRSINWNLLNVNTLLWDGSQQRLAAADQAVADGGRIIALMMPMASTLHLDFVTGMVFDSFPGWVDLFEMSLDDRLAALQDPARRARMREGVETADSTVSRRVAQWDRIVFGTTFTDETRALQGRSVGAVADERGGHPFDVLLDVVVADGLRTSLVLPPVGDDDESWRLRARVWSDPRAVIGGSDAGAHVDMIDTFVYSTEMLGPNVRAGRVTLEEAVRLLTSVPAGLYGLRGRGALVPRCHADVIVFDPATIAAGPRYMRDDMPGGASRLYSDATGIEHVLVNGTPVARAGTLTGDLPGTVLRSARDTDTIRIPR